MTEPSQGAEPSTPGVATRRMKRYVSTTFLAGTIVFALAGCAAAALSTRRPGGFAIYLLAASISPADVVKMDLAGLTLADEPIISVDDLISYDQRTHEMELTPAAYNKLQALKVPVSGIPFAAVVDRQVIYLGAFWGSYSSLSFDGIVIDVLRGLQKRTLRLQLGYPETEFFVGKDRRGDSRIFQALGRAGKLK